MKNIIYIFTALLIVAKSSLFAQCTQTLSVGANVAAAVSSAAAGSTICLNAGNYGNVNLWDIYGAIDVTIKSVSGRTASISFNLGKVNTPKRLKFQNLTITSLQVGNGNNDDLTGNIIISNCTFTGQAVIRSSGSNFLVDSCTFDNLSVCTNCDEGRLQLKQGLGIVVTNCHFGGSGESDGIQVNSSGGVTIGPGNVFDGIVQGSYGRHVDAIQLYAPSNVTITGNYFYNCTTFIMAPDGGGSNTVTNNVFNGGTESYTFKLQFGSQSNLLFRHNTVINASVAIDSKTGQPASANAIVKDNIHFSSGYKTTGGNGCSNCTFSYNLFGSSGDAIGSDNIIGAPTFVDGTNPAAYAGYQLTSSSIGYHAASDRNDMGVVYNSSSTQAPTTQTNLAKPISFSLSQNYPNPFNPTTNFEYRIANSGFVSLKIFDVLGREAATLVNEHKSIGIYTVQWDASNLPSGVYFSRLTVQSQEGLNGASMPIVLTK